MRYDQAVNLDDLRRLAKKRLPKICYDFIEGGMEDERALNNGLSKDEIIEAITHLAFYAGWPCAMTGARIAKGVFEAKK